MPWKFDPFQGEMIWVQSSVGSSPPTNPEVTVAPAATEDLDVLPLASYKSASYFCHSSRAAVDERRSSIVDVSRQGLSNLVHNVHNELGDNVQISFNAVIDGTDVKLQVTNNEATDVVVSCSRFTHY